MLVPGKYRGLGLGTMSCWLRKIGFRADFSILPTPAFPAGPSEGNGLFRHGTHLFFERLGSALRAAGRKRMERRSLGAELEHPSRAWWLFLGVCLPSLAALAGARCVSKANEEGALLRIPI